MKRVGVEEYKRTRGGGNLRLSLQQRTHRTVKGGTGEEREYGGFE
jgi:hypothetical protein